MKKPNFVVIGAPKSGTTSLFYYLHQHPDIYLPTKKELHYFSYPFIKQTLNGPGDDLVLAGLCVDLESYFSHYKAVKNQKRIGEVSPSYLLYDEARHNIKSELGDDVKIIAILRNPVQKAYSQYMHMVREQHETETFMRGLELEPQRAAAGWWDMWLYASSSRYASHLQKYYGTFKKEQILVLIFEDFMLDAPAAMKVVFKFLGLDDTVFIDTEQIYNRTGESKVKEISTFLNHPSSIKSFFKKIIPDKIRLQFREQIMRWNTGKKPAIDPRAEAFLNQYFKEDIQAVSDLLGRKLPW